MLVLTLLAACGGGGGGDRAQGVVPGPPPPNSTPPPNPSVPSSSISVADIDADSRVDTAIVGLVLGSPPTIRFSLLVDGFRTVGDLEPADVRFTFAALEPGAEPEGLDWRSLIVTTEDPVCRSQADVDSSTNACTTFTTETDPAAVPDSALKVQDPVAIGRTVADQATYERNGVLAANDDGTWRYTFDTDPGDAGALDNLHRVCIQFDLASFAGNPCIDFVPAEVAAAGDGTTGTSLEPQFYETRASRQVVATASCNSCHADLAVHGGNRRGVDYCTTCHNPGTVDANSTNSQDFAVLTHRIHYSASIPSVAAGTPYKIWGFRNTEQDYSDVSYPQSAANCTRCHAGQEDVTQAEAEGRAAPLAVVTPDGHNWASKPSGAACGACHENRGHLEALEGRCSDCHAEGGEAGSVVDSHANRIGEAAGSYRYEIVDVSGTGPGEQPVIDFRIVDPGNADAAYDITSDAPFVQGGGASRIAVTVGWSTTDYSNTGNGEEDASTVSIDALAEALNIGDDVFRVTSPVAIPDGTQPPFVAATGSGAVTIEGHPAEVVDGTLAQIPVRNALRYFSIDEAGGEPVPRREIADLALCANCHDSLVLHGSNRTDNLQACATCHNPRNTDRAVRLVALDPPTDGKDEESIDFKTMTHAIHASAMRENALEIVGFRGFTTYRYDEAHVQYPGRLANCAGCHRGDSYALPLTDSVLGTTVDTGTDLEDPGDDTVVSPTTAVCASCHDSALAAAHMESFGGDFATTQAFLDNATTVEQCATCHASGRSADVAVVHDVSRP